MLKITRIEILFSEFNLPKYIKEKTPEEIVSYLETISYGQRENGNGSYYKTDLNIHFDNHSPYRIRFDLGSGMEFVDHLRHFDWSF